jgi:catechol 2,3-dioxygenase-like lactoylglutathione lyase family enzyme
MTRSAERSSPSTTTSTGARAGLPLAGEERRWRCDVKITLSSVFVDDQAKALRFYTEVLGFVVKTDVPAGEHRWLTVASPEGPPGVELLLEPDAHPAAREFQKALHRDGIPATSFESADIRREHERLLSLGVVFRTPPTPAGPVTVAVFDDTCGNLIQLHQAGGPR